jgi:hypothetical protein
MNKEKRAVKKKLSSKLPIKKITPKLAKKIFLAPRGSTVAKSKIKNERFKRSRLVFWFQVLKMLLLNSNNPIYNNGIHLIEGSTGTGKTLLMNIIQTNLLQKKGFMWSNVNQFYTSKVKNFDMANIWNNGKTQYVLPKKLEGFGNCKGIIIDEVNRLFNRRLNRTNIYNEIFIPLVSDIVRHRHLGYPRIYFIGQAEDLQDTQLQSIIRYRHLVKSKKRYYFYFWHNELKIIKAPYKIKIEHLIKDKKTDNYKKYKTTKIKVSIKDLMSYNTYGFAADYNDIPTYTDFS